MGADASAGADDRDPASRVAAGALAAIESMGRSLVAVDRLHGGTIASTLVVTLDDGTRMVLKQSRHAIEGAWDIEADGLDALRVEGGPLVPAVHAFGDDFLLIEELPHPVPDDGEFWEVFGRQLAVLHGVTNAQHGWHRENLLGAVTQRNDWHDDGWVFFGQCRLLRYLELENVQAALDVDDRALLERVASRLPDLVPAQPASLVHGDLWRPNVLAASATEPALCDPAATYGWAEIDISMLLCSGGVPDACFAAYEEVRPLDAGWRDRAPLLHVREQLSVLAHIGYDEATVRDIRATLERFA